MKKRFFSLVFSLLMIGGGLILIVNNDIKASEFRQEKKIEAKQNNNSQNMINKDVKNHEKNKVKATKSLREQSVVFYVDQTLGNDENDGSINAPKATIQNVLDILPNGSENVEIKVVSTTDQSVSVPKNKGIEHLTIESANDTLPTFYRLVANGVTTTIKDVSITEIIGGGYNEDIQGDTSIEVLGVNQIINVSYLYGGGVSTDGSMSATVFGNTHVKIDNFKVASGYEANIIGGGKAADVHGDTNVNVSNSQAPLNSTTIPAILGGGYIPATRYSGTLHANVYGNTNLNISDGYYGNITGNTNRRERTPRYLQATESIVDGKVTIKLNNLKSGDVYGNSSQVQSGSTGATVLRSYGSYKVNNGIDINVSNSTLSSGPAINSKTALGNALGLRVGSRYENGDSYIKGNINVSIDESIIQGVFLGDMIDTGIPENRYAAFEGGQAEIDGNITLDVKNDSKITMIHSLSTAQKKAYNGTVASRDVWSKIKGNIDISAVDSAVQYTVGSLSNRVDVGKDKITLDGDLTYNYKDLTAPVKSIVAGFEYSGIHNGNLTLNLENIYGNYSNSTAIDYIFAHGDGNGLTAAGTAAIEINGKILFDFKNVDADEIYAGSRVGNTVLNGSVAVKLLNSQVRNNILLGNYNQSDSVNTSKLNGDVSLAVDGTSSYIKDLIVGSRVLSAGRNAENNGDAKVELLNGTIENLYASGMSNNVNALAKFNGDIDIFIGRNVSFTNDISNIYSATTNETTTNGNKKLTLENGTIVGNFYNNIYPFDEIHLGNTLEITDNLYANNTNPSKLNILGSWNDGDTLIAGKNTNELNGFIPELAWFEQNWGANPVMHYEDNGTYNNDNYRGRWYLEGARLLHRVDFESYGGTSVDSIVDIASGNTINEPIPPTKDNHVFDGWYTDSTFETKWNFISDQVNSSMTLHAKWIAEDEPETPSVPPINDNQDDSGEDIVTNSKNTGRNEQAITLPIKNTKVPETGNKSLYMTLIILFMAGGLNYSSRYFKNN